MSLNATINVPGLINVAFPFSGSTITSYVRLNGTIFANKDELPAGIDFIKNQLPASMQDEVLLSHALQGKRYWIQTLNFFIDGNPIRQVDFTLDETPFYQFDEDYLPVFFSDEEIPVGSHQFQIQVFFFSIDNPGVIIFDTLGIDFIYDNTGPSLIDTLNKLSPPLVSGEIDTQLLLQMIDYAFSSRTEGAIKTDIDFLATLYDLDTVPDTIIPYLAATVGYDYFAGLLGNNFSIREELRFLPEWQKSAGTKRSIELLLIAQRFNVDIKPLYLDLQNHRLLPGVKARYESEDEFLFQEDRVDRRFTFPLTHGANFVRSSVVFSTEASITLIDGTIQFVPTFEAVFDEGTEAFVIRFISDGVSSPDVPAWATINETGAAVTEDDIQSLLIDRLRGGATLTFDQTVRFAEGTRFKIGYIYELDARPGRLTRLSEFFDVVIRSEGAPNVLTVSDYRRLSDTVLRSKPFRTKMRQIVQPAKYADAYIVNPFSFSTTGEQSNRDRLEDNNIDIQAVQIRNPIRETVNIRHKRTELDGFLFSWEKDCDRFENRFSFFKNLTVDVCDYNEAFREVLRRDLMLQRHHTILVPDDTLFKTAEERRRFLPQLGFNILNFKGGDEPGDGCIEVNDYTSHFHTVEHSVLSSPAIEARNNMVIELDTVQPIGPADPITLNIDFLNVAVISPLGNLREWHSILWTGSGTFIEGINDVLTGKPFDVDLPDRKEYSFTRNGIDFTLLFVRFPDQATLDAFYVERPTLNNYPFEVGGSPEAKWYAIVDASGDFFDIPIHLSVDFSNVFANFQNACDCCQQDLGEITFGAFSSPSPMGSPSPFLGAIVFDELLGEKYKFDPFIEVEVIRQEDNRQVQLFRWTGGWWKEVKNEDENIELTLNLITMDPSLTVPISVSGQAVYVGSGPVGDNVPYNYLVRMCAKKTGDLLAVKINAHFEDDFGAGIFHDGTFGVMDQDARYFAEQDTRLPMLFEHRHDQGNQNQPALDSHYFKDQNLWPGFRYTIALDTPEAISSLAQMIYDLDSYDDVFFYDTSPSTARYVQILHFPKKLVFLTLDEFDIDIPFFYTPIESEAWESLTIDDWIDLLMDEWLILEM